MKKDIKRLHELLQEGKCCSVALVQLGLEHTDQKNPQLLEAVSGLCGGVRNSLLCGALTGAACMANILDPKNANTLIVPELAEWFIAEMGEQYGGADCAEILGGDPNNKKTRCPALIEATYLKAMEILEKHGHEFK